MQMTSKVVMASTSILLSIIASSTFPARADQPTTRPAIQAIASGRLSCSLTVIRVERKWYCKLEWMNHTDHQVSVPRWPRGLSVTPTEREIKDSGPGKFTVEVGGGADLFRRDKSVVKLGPHEGFVKCLPLDRHIQKAGKYEVMSDLERSSVAAA